MMALNLYRAHVIMSRSRVVCRDYPDKSGSDKQCFLELLIFPKLNLRFWIGKNQKLGRNSMEMSLAFASFTNFLQRMYGNW